MLPPLLGDGHGRYKVHFIGNSGTGKSTTAIEIARILGVPYISLDSLFWKPGWAVTPADEFTANIRAAMAQSDKGWVVDGNYQNSGATFVTEECTDVIWMDPPLILYFPRIFIRTMARLFGQRPPCSPGCGESVREVFFSSDSILWWALSHHWPARTRGQTMMLEMGITSDENAAGRKMRRLGGWGKERQGWLESVAEMCRAK